MTYAAVFTKVRSDGLIVRIRTPGKLSLFVNREPAGWAVLQRVPSIPRPGGSVVCHHPSRAKARACCDGRNWGAESCSAKLEADR